MRSSELDTEESQLVADLAREMVAEHAPDELPLFKALSLGYFDPEETPLNCEDAPSEVPNRLERRRLGGDT